MYTRSTLRFAFALAACAAVFLLTLTPAAHAQTFFPNNTTLDASNPVTGFAVVGFANQTDESTRTHPTSPTVNLVSGGSVGRFLVADNSSIVNLSGGSVGGALEADNSSTVNVSGGSVGGALEANDSGIVNLSGGSVSDVFAFNSGIVNVSGGSVGGALEAGDNGSINLFGMGLIALFEINNSNFSQYSLSGTLSDGTVLVNKELLVQNGTGARFTLNNTAVPEPGSVALFVGLTMAAANLMRKRRVRK